MRNFTLTAVSGLLGLFLSLLSLESYSAPTIRTATATGNWSAPATWGGSGNMPIAGDLIKINKGVTLTCDTTMNVASIGCANAGTGSASALVINVGKTLTVNGIVDLAPYGTTNTAALTVNGTLICTGGLQSMEVYGGTLGLTLLTGSFTSITVASTGTLNIGAGFATDQALGFSVTNNGIITGTTLAFTQALAKTISGSGSFNFTGGAVSLTQCAVTGTLSFSGSTLALSATSLACSAGTFSGAITLASASTLTVASSITGTSLTATGGTINGAGTHTLSGFITIQTSANVSSSLTTSGTNANITITGSTVSGTIRSSTSGNITMSGTTALSSTVSTASGTLTFSGTTTGTGKIVATGAGAVSGNFTGSKMTCGAMTISTFNNTVAINADSVVCSSFSYPPVFGDYALTFTATYLSCSGNFTTSNDNNITNTFTLTNFAIGGNLAVSTARYNSTGAIFAYSVKGTGVVTGNLTLSKSDVFSSFGYPQLVFNIGNTTNSASLSVTGDLSMTSTCNTASDSINLIRIYNGTFSVDDITMSETTAGSINNMILVYDVAPYNYNKAVYIQGNVTNASQGIYLMQDPESNGMFTTYFNGSGKSQTIPFDNSWNFKRIEIANQTDSVSLSGTLVYPTNIAGKITVANGAKFCDAGYAFGVTGNTALLTKDSLEIANGGTFFIRNTSASFPQFVDYLSNSAGGIIYFLYNSTASDTILKYPVSTVGQTSAKSLGNVTVGGTGIKLVYSPLSASATGGLSVENLTVAGGTLTFQSTSTHFDLVAGSLSPTQTVTVSSGATLQIPRDFTVTSNSPAAKFSFAETSTLEYSQSGNQNIYRMHSTTAGSGSLASLGNLTLSGSGSKSIADSVKVARKVSITGTSVLALGANSKLTLSSTSTTQTGYIGQITSTTKPSITYASGARIYAQRYISLPTEEYRDFSSPMQTQTLSNWQDAGMLLTGFTGTTYPDFYYVNAYNYDETATGDLENGWTAATNVSNPVRTLSGAKIRRGGWRIYSGQTGGLNFTLNDSGQVYTDTVTFQGSFTRTGTNTEGIVDDGWNFFGNPYPCGINMQSFYTANSSKFKGDSTTTGGFAPTVYTWMPYDRQAVSGPLIGTQKYGSYNFVTNAKVGMTDAVVPEYQGFWLKAYDNNATGTTNYYDLILAESHKNDGAGTYLKANPNSDGPLMAGLTFTSPSGALDEVKTHFWPRAKMGFDFSYDIQKYGVDSTQLSIHIAGENDEPIWVNAMPEEAMDYTFDLYLNTVDIGIHTISWENIAELFGNYSCVRLVDNETHMSYDMLQTSSMTFDVTEGFSGKRFTVIARKLVDLSQTATTNPTCNGKDNGSVELSLPKNTGGYFFSVFDKNLGDFVAIAQGDLDKIQINLKAGSYSLINNKSTECGMGSYDFELVDPAPVVAKFAADKTYILPGATVEFENNSTGGINFVWSFSDDMSESYDKHTSHTYPLPGTYNVTLKVSNADPDCYQTKSEQIRVADPNGVTEQDVNGLKLVAVKGGINYVNPFPEKAHLAVHTLDGKLILDQDMVDPNGTVNLKTSGSFVATLSSGSKVITRQLVVF